MATIKLGSNISDIRGKVGGNVFSKNRNGNYLKVKSNRKGTETKKWNAQKLQIGVNSQQWRELTDEERNAWMEQAQTFTVKNKVGDDVHLSGFNYFTSVNGTQNNTNQIIKRLPPDRPVFNYPEIMELEWFEEWQWQAQKALMLKSQSIYLEREELKSSAIVSIYNDSECNGLICSVLVNWDFIRQIGINQTFSLMTAVFSSGKEIKIIAGNTTDEGFFARVILKTDSETSNIINLASEDLTGIKYFSVGIIPNKAGINTTVIKTNNGSLTYSFISPFKIEDEDTLSQLYTYSYGLRNTTIISPLKLSGVKNGAGELDLLKMVFNYENLNETFIIDFSSFVNKKVDCYLIENETTQITLEDLNFDNLFVGNSGTYFTPYLVFNHDFAMSTNQNFVIRGSKVLSNGRQATERELAVIANIPPAVLGTENLSYLLAETYPYLPNNACIFVYVSMFDKSSNIVDTFKAVPAKGKVRFKAGSELSSRVN